jgi:hypothetical protein
LADARNPTQAGNNGTAQRKEQFAASVLAMLFPRSSIAGGSFWNYDPKIGTGDAVYASSGSELADRLKLHQQRLNKLGVAGCPSYTAADGCPKGCAEAVICGKPFANAPVSNFPLETNCPYHF